MDQENTNNSLMPCAYYDNLCSIGFIYEFKMDEIRIQNTVEKLLEVLEIFSPVFQPITLNVHLTGYERAIFPEIEKCLNPTRPYFQLRERDSPPWVDKGEIDPDVEITYVEELSPQTTREWLQKIIAFQEDPSPRHVLVINSLVIRCARAKLLDEARWEGEEAFPLLTWGEEIHLVPLERRRDGLWVSGPSVNSWIQYPALSISYYNSSDYVGAVKCFVNIMWSWWRKQGHAEHDALEQTFKKLANKGWLLHI